MQLTRRRFLQVADASAATLALTQAVPRRAEAATWRLHEDTDTVGLHQLYSGGDNPPGCDTGEDAGCSGPGRMSCYWGALYVNSVTEHRLRTGPFSGSCSADWPGPGNAERVRWGSHLSASVWAPEYRFLGKLYVYDIMARPDPWTGLMLHPVHLDNCHNYWIRLWERISRPTSSGGGRWMTTRAGSLAPPCPPARSWGDGTTTGWTCSRAAG
jgi:hypothetical protein